MGTTSCTDRLSRHGWNFNPRPLTGATPRQSFISQSERNFNPRPLTGATRAGSPPTTGWQDFNPRPLTGATSNRCCRQLTHQISIHAPSRGRRLFKIHFLNCGLFQSTPPHGGDHPWCWQSAVHSYFNPRPHAGATWAQYSQRFGILFQSTPPRGGDEHVMLRLCSGQYFNPRPLAGATKIDVWDFYREIISIHAPIRGRLAVDAVLDYGHLISIHAPIRGRHKPSVPAAAREKFQSTPPHGGDPCVCLINNVICYFNPRPLTGATSLPLSTGPAPRKFQSTPPRGGDLLSLYFCFELSDFNPRPLAGATLWAASVQRLTRFQSTPPRGGDLPGSGPWPNGT